MEDLLSSYTHVLTLRVRMPISEDLEFPRNFLYKISRYPKVVNIPNSMTVLPELMPMSVEMAKRKLKGIYNFRGINILYHILESSFGSKRKFQDFSVRYKASG